MSITIAELADTVDLRLTRLHASRDERPVEWASSSDLDDPTPFLVDNQLLLTTGTQFAPTDSASRFQQYVQTLLRRGVLALGFGVGFGHTATPDALVAACRQHDLPLVEVPYETAFIALIQRVVHAAERDARQRDAWTLTALRALSAAAVPRGDIGAVLRVLATHLHGDVILFDSDGLSERSFPNRSTRASEFRPDVQQLLAGTRRTAFERSIGDEVAMLQTLGPREGFAGALVAIVPSHPDRQARTVLAAAVALLEVQIAETRRWTAVSLATSQVVLSLLDQGQMAVAGEIAEASGRPLPRGPVAIILGGSTDGRQVEATARHEVALTARLVAISGAGIVAAVAPSGLEPTARRWSARGLSVGTTMISGFSEWQQGRARARAAQQVAAVGAWQQWERMPPPGDRAELAARALSLLQAVLAVSGGSEEIESAKAWFDHNCSWGAAARELSLHPHTVRDRVASLGRRLGVDITRFSGRVLMWTVVDSAATATGG